MLYSDISGELVELADQIGSGREGGVYRIIGSRGIAKIYHDPTPELAGKVEVMARAVPLLLRLKEEMMMHLGWPAKPLYKHPDKTGFVGFEMRAAPKGSVPIDLIVQFPSNEKAPVLTMQQKIKVLMDFCHLTSELHIIGVIVGDWNGSNLLVSETGRITMIDVDAYGFTLHGEHYPSCALPGYVAPEILRQMKALGINDFSELADIAGKPVFTPATDAFGLAVHIFEMLNFGIHPFDGEVDPALLDADEIPAPVSLNRNVRSGLSPFICTLPDYVVPDYALRLCDFPRYLREAFERSLFGSPDERLTPHQWEGLLAFYRSEAIECSHGHLYHPSSRQCPYCRGEDIAARRLGVASLHSEPRMSIS